MNVMLTCAGRRNYSVEIFKEAVGDWSRVFACDSSTDAPALQKANKAFIVPRVDQEDYIETLLAICDDHQIGLLVPAIEPELLLLTMNRARFFAIGTIPLVSSPEITATCCDKLATFSAEVWSFGAANLGSAAQPAGRVDPLRKRYKALQAHG